ncbi:hypothetical protein OSB04_028903 [Centaurea solstitialis]|uniref:GAG-pre-integrase domain-containing protein n=1 Tax=Centaurea solstitialis TaxID=347529 RepID=A0AA38T081_9ASTR|nr:hypothetical protein OSB04_028903 [Centaurea solstitialis]
MLTKAYLSALIATRLWDHNREPQKKNSKKAPMAAVAESNHTSATALNAESYNGMSLDSSLPVENSDWIIDSGATDLMMFDARNTSSLTYTSRKFVTIANGTSTPVMGKGTSNLSVKMNLNSVLVVPSLDYNLLSVSQITTNLNCVVLFWADCCVSKDIPTKKTIGYGVRRGKLYYLELEPKTSKRVERALVAKGHQGIKKELDIWLYHRRFGHTSFGYLKRLFPTLFNKCDVSKFHCEVCERAKSHRASSPLTLSKNTLPFMTIHSDVWGSSKVPTISEA